MKVVVRYDRDVGRNYIVQHRTGSDAASYEVPPPNAEIWTGHIVEVPDALVEAYAAWVRQGDELDRQLEPFLRDEDVQLRHREGA